MSHLLAVDPSLRGTGWACFRHGLLVNCGVIVGDANLSNIQAVQHIWRNMPTMSHFGEGDEVVLEFPRIYPKGHKSKETDRIDPNDLLWVAAVAGAFSAHALNLMSYYPSDWKGQSKKEKTLRLVLQACTPSERAVIESVTGWKRHNAVDAVGIGMYHLKRIGKNLIKETA